MLAHLGVDSRILRRPPQSEALRACVHARVADEHTHKGVQPDDTQSGRAWRGFRGLELSTILSEAFTDGLDLTLIDQSDHFVFGFSKLDVMFGRETLTPCALRTAIVKPGVRFRRERITAIDPVARRVTTDAGTYDADVLVVALAPTTTSTRPRPRRSRQRVLLRPGRLAPAGGPPPLQRVTRSSG